MHITGCLKFASASVDANENNLLKLDDLGIHALEFRHSSERLNKSACSKSSMKACDVTSSMQLPKLIESGIAMMECSALIRRYEVSQEKQPG